MDDRLMDGMEEAFLALSHGYEKYGKALRRHVSPDEDILAGIGHAIAHLRGKPIDGETGVSALGHAIARLCIAAKKLRDEEETTVKC